MALSNSAAFARRCSISEDEIFASHGIILRINEQGSRRRFFDTISHVYLETGCFHKVAAVSSIVDQPTQSLITSGQ